MVGEGISGSGLFGYDSSKLLAYILESKWKQYIDWGYLTVCVVILFPLASPAVQRETTILATNGLSIMVASEYFNCCGLPMWRGGSPGWRVHSCVSDSIFLGGSDGEKATIQNRKVVFVLIAVMTHSRVLHLCGKQAQLVELWCVCVCVFLVVKALYCSF